jgi:hypothetical protein
MPNWLEWPTLSNQTVENWADSRIRVSASRPYERPFRTRWAVPSAPVDSRDYVAGGCLFDAIELGHHDTLSNPLFIGLDDFAARAAG